MTEFPVHDFFAGETVASERDIRHRSGRWLLKTAGRHSEHIIRGPQGSAFGSYGPGKLLGELTGSFGYCLLCFKSLTSSLTNYALTVPGNWEANPIMRLSQAHLGAAWWMPKIVVVGFAAVLAKQMSQQWPILFAVSYYLVIVSGNLACL